MSQVGAAEYTFELPGEAYSVRATSSTVTVTQGDFVRGSASAIFRCPLQNAALARQVREYAQLMTDLAEALEANSSVVAALHALAGRRLSKEA